MENRRQRPEVIKTPSEFGTGKSILILAVVIGCFAILWPKIFYPMMQTAFTMTSPKFSDGDEANCEVILDVDVKSYPFFAKLCDWLVTRETQVHSSLRMFRKPEAELPLDFIQRCQSVIMNVCKIDLLSVLKDPSVEDTDTFNLERTSNLSHCLRRYFSKKNKPANKQSTKDRPPHLHLPTRMRETLGETRPSDIEGKIHFKEGRPFPHPSTRQPPRASPKSGGTMGIIMPLYTVGIVGFFLYTLLKIVFKKKPEETTEPMINDFHFDSNYHNYRSLQTDSQVSRLPREKKSEKNDTCRTKSLLEQYGKHKDTCDDNIVDEKDHEINELKKRLQETEAAMGRIMQHVGVVGEQVVNTTNAYQSHADSTNCSVRKRIVPDAKKDEETTDTCISNPRIEELTQASSIYNQQEEEIRSMDSTPDSDSYEVVSSREKDTTDEDERESSSQKMESKDREEVKLEAKSSDDTSSYENLSQDPSIPSNSDSGSSRGESAEPLNGEIQPASELMKALNFDSLSSGL